MEKQYKRKLLLLVWMALVGAMTALLILFVLRTQLERFHMALYISSNFLSSQQIFNATMQRTILAVMLYSFGLACIFLYFISYETENFLNYTRVFWYAAGFVVSLWDYETVFYAAKPIARLWRVSGDVCLTLLVQCVFCAILEQIECGGKTRFRMLCRGLCLMNLAFSLYGNFRISVFSMRVFFVALSILTAALYASYLSTALDKKRTVTNLLGILVVGILLLCLLAFTFLVSFYKYQTLSSWYTVYLKVLGYLVAVYTVVLFTRFFQYHRTGLFLGGETNRKILEITRYKQMITKLILDQCRTPVENLLAYKEKQTEAADPAYLQNLFREINRLRDTLSHIEDVHRVYGQSAHSEQIKISITALMHYTAYLLQSKRGYGSVQMSFEQITEDDFVYGDPYLLLQANEAFWTAAQSVGQDESTEFRIQKTEKETVRGSIRVPVDPEKLYTAKRIRWLIASRSESQPIRGDLELGIWAAKNNLLHEGVAAQCQLIKCASGWEFVIQYDMLPWRDGADRRPDDTRSAQHGGEQNQKEILLLSTSPAQIEMICSYLEMEDYTVRCFCTEEDVLRCIEAQRNIGAIIIGTIFFFADIDRFCAKIRERYPMEQLPILVIANDKYKLMDNRLLAYVNDVMVEPFGQLDLRQKIQMMLLLQSSALETVRAKLDFLQVQIDPHFIFNTLSTIMPLCLQKPMLAYEMLTDFSQYLRGRLYANDLQSALPVGREIELIQAYLAIEKVRFPDRIDVGIRIDADESIPILPLLIEPIVENSIKHSIKGQQMLKLRIAIISDEQYLYISVEDDGIGIAEEKLRRILHEKAENPTSIGIHNVKQRLYIYYHETLHIESVPGAGTKTTFRIPVNAFDSAAEGRRS